MIECLKIRLAEIFRKTFRNKGKLKLYWQLKVDSLLRYQYYGRINSFEINKNIKYKKIYNQFKCIYSTAHCKSIHKKLHLVNIISINNNKNMQNDKRTSDFIPLIIDHETVSQQFAQQQILQSKLQLLQAAVFKNYMVRKSKSTFHLTSPTKPKSKHQHDSPGSDNCKGGSLKLIEKQVDKKLRPTLSNIEFPKQSSPKKSQGSLFKTYSHFNPCKTRVPKINRQAIEPAEQTFQRPAKIMSARGNTSPQRDSQSILRKNSLFLMSCLKTKYKNSTKNQPHIGDIPNLTNHMKLAHFSQKNIEREHQKYENRFEYMQKAKQQLIKQKFSKKQIKNVIKPAKHLQLLNPQPW